MKNEWQELTSRLKNQKPVDLQRLNRWIEERYKLCLELQDAMKQEGLEGELSDEYEDENGFDYFDKFKFTLYSTPNGSVCPGQKVILSIDCYLGTFIHYTWVITDDGQCFSNAANSIFGSHRVFKVNWGVVGRIAGFYFHAKTYIKKHSMTNHRISESNISRNKMKWIKINESTNNEMNINDLIVTPQKLADKRGDCVVSLEEVDSDRYGDTIGLVAGGETIMTKYFGGN